MSVQDRYDTDSLVSSPRSPWPYVAGFIAISAFASVLASAFLG
ncbi:hypothetical protein V6L77_04740 [Pannonibacter sp. Pt2-lr]|uniref:Uncharacterized protein n=1 Tax=Pannonibacter anstelovis TaxID=3121537 RepID=A0ABU7ZSS4_9HYPH